MIDLEMDVLEVTCVDHGHQHHHVEEQVDQHGEDHLCPDSPVPGPHLLHGARPLVPVPPGQGDVTVLQAVQDNIQDVELVELLHGDHLDDEDSDGVEEEEDPEQTKGKARIEAGVESVGWRCWVLGVCVVPPVDVIVLTVEINILAETWPWNIIESYIMDISSPYFPGSWLDSVCPP